MIDWYERRNELESGMVFKDYTGGIVRLDRRVPCDGSQWYVETWYAGRPDIPGYENGFFAGDDGTIEPGDLVERLSDTYPN